MRVVVPPLRYLRTDSTGTAIFGLPPIRITQECASCHAWLDSSLYRPLAGACCRCEAVELAGRIQPTASRQAGGGPADTRRGAGAQKAFSARPNARPRQGPRVPGLIPPCKAPQRYERDKFGRFSVRDRQFMDSDTPRLNSTRQPRTPRKQENDTNDLD